MHACPETHHRVGSYVIVALAALATGLLLGEIARDHFASRADWPAETVPHPRTLNTRTQSH